MRRLPLIAMLLLFLPFRMGSHGPASDRLVAKSTGVARACRRPFLTEKRLRMDGHRQRERSVDRRSRRLAAMTLRDR